MNAASKSRAEVLLHQMVVIERYTLDRALDGLTQEEFDWQPHDGAWAVSQRDQSPTPDPFGPPDAAWVLDFDRPTWEASYRGELVEPMATIGWLLNHFGAAPGVASTLTFLGGDLQPTPEAYGLMWNQSYCATADAAVARVREGWAALRSALERSTDEMLEIVCPEFPWTGGDRSVAALLNEISHHGAQVCTLRDLYYHRVTVR